MGAFARGARGAGRGFALLPFRSVSGSSTCGSGSGGQDGRSLGRGHENRLVAEMWAAGRVQVGSRLADDGRAASKLRCFNTVPPSSAPDPRSAMVTRRSGCKVAAGPCQQLPGGATTRYGTPSGQSPANCPACQVIRGPESQAKAANVMWVKKLPSRSQTTSIFAQNNCCANARTPESRKTCDEQDQLPVKTGGSADSHQSSQTDIRPATGQRRWSWS